jgi:hypothetical protein
VEQYIENSGTPNERWHITMWVDMPKYSASTRSVLNFRVKSILNSKEEVVNDPNFENSRYIFNIDKSYLGKKVFFDFAFCTRDIADVRSFTFGLCDEGIRWINLNGFTEVINQNYNLLSNNPDEIIKEKDSVAKEDSIFLEAITLEVISGELSKVEINLPEKLSNENSKEKEQAKKITAQNFKKKKK